MNKILSFAALVLVVLIGAQLASAQTATNLCTSGTPVNEVKGWAWSSNIGWISFSSNNAGSGGGNYQVCVDEDGDMGGYAWSSNIGWVSFEPADIVGCPTATPAHVIKTTGVVSGFVRAIAGKGRTDGWDGCIELAGSSHASSEAGKGVRMNPATGAFTGFAWGSEVVGWVDFNAIGGNTGSICTNNCNPGGNQDPIVASCTIASPQTIPVGSNSLTLVPSVNVTSPGTYTHTPQSFPNVVEGVYGAGTFVVTVRDSANPARTAQINCNGVVVNPPTPPVNNAAISLRIGRSPDSATDTALGLNKGESFALKWTNNAPVGSICSAKVYRSGSEYTTAGHFTLWKGQTSEALRVNSTSPIFPNLTSTDMASDTYRFTLSCVDGAGANVGSASVDLILTSSTQIEV